MATTAGSITSKLSTANENTWMRMGAISELMHDPDKAMYSYENALRHNPYNVKALTQLASICRLREQYPKAVEYFQRILNIENTNGEIWGALGHCYLMMDDLQKAYTAYQQALYHLPNPKDPNLWYGIGILYDRYGSFEHAEEAFTAVLKMDAKFEKSNEIYFRLGIIYKQQLKYEQALDCFRYILQKPPRPLSQGDIWFQIGHVYELQKDFNNAKEAYERVLKETPNHSKALQQVGWLFHSNTTMGNQEIAINHLMRSIDSDPSDGQTWYLLGRCYMAQQQYRKAYDAYQQAVYRDGRNPTFWCSIGVLYYQINQYRDALDAYSRAIRLNPYLSEVWYDLGTLYESCNQIQDSLDAYQRAAELDPGNKHIQQRLNALRSNQSNAKNGTTPESDSKESKTIDGHDHEKTPMTLEPRASHVGGEPSRSPRMVPQNIPSVPDLVDLSSDSDKRTLPSAHDLRGKNFEKPKETPSSTTPPIKSVEKEKKVTEKTKEPEKEQEKADMPSSPSEETKDKEEGGMEIVDEEEENVSKSETIDKKANNSSKQKESAEPKSSSSEEREEAPEAEEKRYPNLPKPNFSTHEPAKEKQSPSPETPHKLPEIMTESSPKSENAEEKPEPETSKSLEQNHINHEAKEHKNNHEEPSKADTRKSPTNSNSDEENGKSHSGDESKDREKIREREDQEEVDRPTEKDKRRKVER